MRGFHVLNIIAITNPNLNFLCRPASLIHLLVPPPLQELETVTSTDFFWRYTYYTATRRFSPEQVPVYCSCELPENPDFFMAECDGCLRWFHPHPCEGVDPAEVQATGKFRCRKCRQTTAAHNLPAAPKLAPGGVPAVSPGVGQPPLTGMQLQAWANNDSMATKSFIYSISDT